jgi:hypothetical protein
MSLLRRYLALAVSTTFIAVLAHGAQNQPPVPSKVLPPAQAATTLPARTHTSPITGRVYAIRLEPKELDSDAEEAMEIARNKALAKAAPRPLPKAEATKKSATGKAASSPADISDSEFYRGTDRKAAKLSIADGAAQGFDDVRDLIATLPSKTAMVNHTPRITTEANAGRVDEENRNVQVRCWLYAASRESDNDYHLILGRAPGLVPETYMTMELAGLPPTDAGSFPQLFAARKTLNDFFGSNVPETSYSFFDPPIPVTVEGSLFFDITHARGTPPGPVSLRSNMPVIWEVHPITKIEFEPAS